jgi:esterase
LTVQPKRAERATEAARLDHLHQVAAVAGITVDEFVLPEQVDVIVNKLRIHYLDWGQARLPPVVFLHGGGQTAHTWDIVCLALRAERHCIAMDLRGHGDSEWSSSLDYSLESYAADVEQLMAKLHVRRVVLVGMSLRGLAALTCATRWHAEIAGVVAVDVSPTRDHRAPERIRDFMATTQELETIEEFVEQALVHNPTRDPRLLKTSLRNNLRQLPNGRWTWKYDRRHRERPDIDDFFSAQRATVWACLPAIDAPVLVLRSARSDVLHDEDAEELVRRLPSARWLRVEGASRSIQGENPKGLIDAVSRS